MKHNFQFLLLLALTALLMTTACRRDQITDDDTIIPPGMTTFVETSVRGIISDEAGATLADATIYLGSTQVQSDENGYFQINGIVNAAQPFVRVEKPGYFPSMASFTGKAGQTGRIKVTLRTKSLVAQINSGDGSVAVLPGGGSVAFEKDGFVDASGQAYSGAVNVYATYLDPSKEATNYMVPGGFLGLSASGENQILTSFGMMHVLLESPSGQKLQISKPATLTMPVPADRIGSAPGSIPLWYIDETTSLWKEEGSAIFNGTNYVGKVNHFSWWNCDIGSGYILLEGRLRLGSSHPYVQVRVTQNSGLNATTTTNEQGYFSGGVPANQTFLLEVLNECGDVVYSTTLGPFSSNTNIGDISLDWNTNWSEVHGNLQNCDQMPVTNGLVFVSGGAGNPNFPIAADPVTGAFTTAVASCSSGNLTVTAYDLDALKSSDPISMAIAPDMDFGTISVCDNQIVMGMTLEFNGTTKFIPITNVYRSLVDTTAYLYTFLATDNQGGNTANYEISILNWTGDPSNPLWATSTNFTISGSPTFYLISDTQTGTIVALQEGTQSGELVSFVLDNIVLTENPSLIEYPGCKVTLTATLQ
ncbi:MAG: carboxypeptidase regulatory-like domain-containing protein [Lewinellaceae bacterium]|nr:carboxypeptidase regulatory-like domain-containing protein [Lewinellaceae bacterium]